MSVFGGYKGHWEPTEAVVVTAESYLEAAEAAINSINVRDLAMMKGLRRPPRARSRPRSKGQRYKKESRRGFNSLWAGDPGRPWDAGLSLLASGM